MTEATSLADFFKKAETDERYRKAAIAAYQSSECCYRGTWEDAKNWIERWTDRNVRKTPNGPGVVGTCRNMVQFLNRYIRPIC